ncbi:MAG: UbiX family flavin prenyltransferase [Pseudomonadota bacterium]
MSYSAPLLIGVSGASGVIHAIRLLEITHKIDDLKTALVISKAAERTLKLETDYKLADLYKLTDTIYPPKDIGAKIASGSYVTRGMIIAPCSIKTMSELAYGLTDSLITRAADVCLKERRPVILGVREMPLHTGHLRSMTQLSEMGAIIAPPLPAFYHGAPSVIDMVDQICMRWLSLVGIDLPEKKVWLSEENSI